MLDQSVVHKPRMATLVQEPPAPQLLALASSSVTSRAIAEGLDSAIERALLLPTYGSRERATQLLAEHWMSLRVEDVVRDLDRRFANIPQKIMSPPASFDLANGSWSVDKARFNYCSALMRALQYYYARVHELPDSQDLSYLKIGAVLKDVGFFDIISNPRLFNAYNSCQILLKLGKDSAAVAPSWEWKSSDNIVLAELRERFPGIHSPQMYELMFFARMGQDLTTFTYDKTEGLFKRRLRPEMLAALRYVLGEGEHLSQAGRELKNRAMPITGLRNTIMGVINSAAYYFERVQDLSAKSQIENTAKQFHTHVPDSWMLVASDFESLES